jgi:phosphoadenosine phosphosulfate reductase
MIARRAPRTPIFTLDTGRLFPETLDLLQRTRDCYGIAIRVYFPDARDVEEMVDAEGPNLFRRGVEQRKRCCHVRKVLPLRRALHGLDAWMCGLRRGQSGTREAVEPIGWDGVNRLVKINPLADWSDAQVRAYVAQHRVPYNPLHDQGFPSIGCACCTRAVLAGEDPRAGRWWWEAADRKECGLHWQDGKLVRRRSACSQPE